MASDRDLVSLVSLHKIIYRLSYDGLEVDLS